MPRPRRRNAKAVTLSLSLDVINLIDEYRKNLPASYFVEQAILAVVKGQKHTIELSQNLSSTQNELKRLQEENEKLRREKEKLEKKLENMNAEKEENLEKILLSPQQFRELQRKKAIEKIANDLSSALESTEEWRAPLKELCHMAGVDYSFILTIPKDDITYYDGHKTTLWGHGDIEVKRENNEIWLYKDGWWERVHREEIESIGKMLEEGKAWEEVVREYYLKTQGREPYPGEVSKMFFEFWKSIGKKRYMAKYHEGWYMEKQDGSYILHRELHCQPKEVEAYA